MLDRSPVHRGQPLPLRPAGSVRGSDAADLVETDEGGAVFVWGMAAWCWDAGDVVARRLAAVSLAETGAAGARLVKREGLGGVRRARERMDRGAVRAASWWTVC